MPTARHGPPFIIDRRRWAVPGGGTVRRTGAESALGWQLHCHPVAGGDLGRGSVTATPTSAAWHEHRSRFYAGSTAGGSVGRCRGPRRSCCPRIAATTWPCSSRISTWVSADWMACGPLTTIRSQLLRSSFCIARRCWSSVSRAKATIHWDVLAAANAATTSGVSTSSNRTRRPSCGFCAAPTSRGPIIARRGHGDQAVAAGKDFQTRRQHVLGGHDGHHFGGGRIRDADRPADDHHLVSVGDGGRGQRRPHPSAGGVRQVPHRVEVLTRRTGSDEDARHGSSG